MAEVNGLSDSEKDTDTESLPEVTHSKVVANSKDQNVWKLHQDAPGTHYTYTLIYVASILEPKNE
jgi:hypothetical protein